MVVVHPMFDEEFKARKALVTLAIEKSLLEFGEPVYDLVTTTLKKKYNCYLPDCYVHPEYLSEILNGLYGNAHKIILMSINKQLIEVSEYKGIASFLGLLETHMKFHDMMKIYGNYISELSNVLNDKQTLTSHSID